MHRAAWLLCLALLGAARLASAADCSGFSIAQAAASAGLASACAKGAEGAGSSSACSFYRACTNGTVAASVCDPPKLLASFCLESPTSSACSR
jgi:hypothetical protein